MILLETVLWNCTEYQSDFITYEDNVQSHKIWNKKKYFDGLLSILCGRKVTAYTTEVL